MKRSPNSKYYRNKCDELFMSQFRGESCEVCGAIEGTAGHHLIGKGRSKALRYDKNNIVVVCQKHHTLGNTMAPHSTNHLAVERFHNWFKATKPEQHSWIKENENIDRRYTYKQAAKNLLEGRLAWEK